MPKHADLSYDNLVSVVDDVLAKLKGVPPSHDGVTQQHLNGVILQLERQKTQILDSKQRYHHPEPEPEAPDPAEEEDVPVAKKAKKSQH